MTLTKKYHTFFKQNLFYLLDYNNGLAVFRTEEVEDGFLCYYDIICSINDNSLEVLEDEKSHKFTYSIDEIYDLTDYVVEINQHDVFTIKSDVLFSNVERRNEQKAI